MRVLWSALAHTSLVTSKDHKPEWFGALYDTMQQAHEHWAQLSLDWFDWCAHVISSIQHASKQLPVEDWLDKCMMEELYLAFGCLWGSDEALQIVQQQSESMLQQIVKRFATPPLMPEELQQELWIRLFVSTEKRQAKISTYTGQGPLNAWIRVTAVRACIDYTRTHPHLKREKVTEKQDLLALPEQTLDVELDFLKHEYREHFKDAFARGVASLPSRDRMLLRYHVVDGLSIDQLGALFQFHRSTAARHLNQARQRLLEATEEELMKELHISKTEFHSVMRLIQSRWEVSVQRLLNEQS